MVSQKRERCIVWFRLDLRLSDNPALHAAVSKGYEIVPLYIWDPESESPWQPGEASCSWLHHSLKSLDQSLGKLGGKLAVVAGSSVETLNQVVAATGAKHIFWNRRYEPAVMLRDGNIKHDLTERGFDVQSFNSHLLAEPWEISNQSGKPFRVFTPFWKHHMRNIRVKKSLPKPSSIACFGNRESCFLEVEDLQLTPRRTWDHGFYQRFRPGEGNALKALKSFIKDQKHSAYTENRNRPDFAGTSRLSPHLHFGEISPRQIVNALRSENATAVPGAQTFLSEIGWREFAYHLLYHFPHTTENPLKEKFEEFPWELDSLHIDAWKNGNTGIPIIDAGMRELWHTGWMHNRVRMIASSYLVKNLLVPWQQGSKWFWNTLVDADLASNTMGWQWVAGSGADAAPYFRIFNPVLQSKRFDPSGEYIRKWIPELQDIPSPLVHTPWHDDQLLEKTGYSEKRISLIESRHRALAAYEKMQSNPKQVSLTK